MKRTGYGLILLGIAVGLISLEILLRFYVTFIAEPQQARRIPTDVPDAHLKWRGNPAYPGMDARGWRNAAALDRADVVVLGDSMAWGFNVAREVAWPQRLGRLLRRTVYQMALPGYGPGQYLLLFDQAAALKPKVLIVDYYLGNDDWDAYSLTYHLHRYSVPDPMLDSFQSTDPRVLSSIRRAEAIDPNLVRQDWLSCYPGSPQVPDPHLQQVHDILASPPLVPLQSETSARSPASPARRTSLRTRIGNLLRTSVVFRLGQNSLNSVVYRMQLFQSTGLFPGAKDYGPPVCVHFRDRGLKTIFQAAYRVISLDRTDPRMAEGRRIALLIYKRLAERSRRAGIRFYVTVTPTKEVVFRARALASLGSAPIPPAWRYLQEAWDEEAAARSEAFTFFRREGIASIDALPALEGVAAAGVNPYPEDANSHPLEPGYGAIARDVAERLFKDGFDTLR